VEDVLYKVHLSNMKRLSPVVQGIFEIPDSAAGPKQGSEENPIILQFFTTTVFEDFLAWIYRAEWQPLEDADVEVKERMLVNLLHVARLWEISEALDWINDTDLNRLGVKVYSIIARAKEVLWNEMRLACRVPPELDENPPWVSDEHDHRVCVEVFKEIWWTKIAKKVLDPVKPLHFYEIAAEVRK
ncbi:hypothetical protein GGX14DRAFT_332003, partial [Mycena pura]